MQKTTTSTILIALLTMLFACKKDIPLDRMANGVVVSRSYNWKKSLHLNGAVSNSFVLTPIYYNGNIAIPTTNGGDNRRITLMNPANGDFIWSWDDRYQPATEYSDIDYYYQHNNLLTYQKGNRSYCINMDTGTTQWKFQRSEPFEVRIFASNDSNFFNLFNVTDANGYLDQRATKIDVNTGNLTAEVIGANFSGDYIAPNNLVGAITNIVKVPNNNDLYAITYAEPLPGWEVNSFLGLYNSATEQWVYERKLMAPPTVNSSAYEPKIYNDKLYAWVGKNIVCHDIVTGEQIWIKTFAQDFMFSGFIIAEGKIIANCEDGYTYGIDPDTGTILWQTRSAGTSSRMSYLNGVVYFVGGSTGKLHAIDVANGRMLWAIEAPNLGEGDGNYFKTNAIYVFEAANGNPARVIALSHAYAYCFNAER